MIEGVGGWLLAVVGGGVLAALYFGGLWWTVQRLTHARNPALLAAASYLVRTVAVAAALFLVASGDALRLLAALAGFLAVRAVVVRSMRSAVQPVAATAGIRTRAR